MSCVHCDAGHKPTWQAHSKEWVHRNSHVINDDPRKGPRVTGFSTTLCTGNKPAP